MGVFGHALFIVFLAPMDIPDIGIVVQEGHRGEGRFQDGNLVRPSPTKIKPNLNHISIHVVPGQLVTERIGLENSIVLLISSLQGHEDAPEFQTSKISISSIFVSVAAPTVDGQLSVVLQC
jgi:hypothetical protein